MLYRNIIYIIVVLCSCSYLKIPDDYKTPDGKIKYNQIVISLKDILLSELKNNIKMSSRSNEEIEKWLGIKSSKIKAKTPDDASIDLKINEVTGDSQLTIFPVVFYVSDNYSQGFQPPEVQYLFEFKKNENHWVLSYLKPMGVHPDRKKNYEAEGNVENITPDYFQSSSELLGSMEKYALAWQAYVNDGRNIKFLLDSYSSSDISIIRWCVKADGYHHSPEITSVHQLATRIDSVIPLDRKITVELRGVIHYEIYDNGTAGTSCMQLFRTDLKSGKNIYKDYGYKLLSWKSENGVWKIVRERWYPAKIPIKSSFDDMRNNWVLDEREVKLLNKFNK